jgi:hypothetical protein
MVNQAALSPSALGILAERLGPLPLINHFLARMGLLELLEQHVPTPTVAAPSPTRRLWAFCCARSSSSANRSTASRRAPSALPPGCSASTPRSSAA